MSQIPCKENLIKALEQGSLLPLVGAGVSMSIKDIQGNRVFPSWPELLNRAAEESSTEYRQLITTFVSLQRLHDAAKEAKKSLIGENWYNFIQSQFNHDLKACEQASFDLASSVWNLGNQIITLNYDRVLKYAGPVDNIAVITNSSPAQVKQFQEASQNKAIWHLHGHIDEPEEMVLTPDSYECLYGDKSKYTAAIQVLKNTMASRSILFIGCSLSDAEILTELAYQQELFNGNSKIHFALIHEDQRELIQEKLKGVNNIQLITFSDFGQPLIDKINEISALKSQKTLKKNLIKTDFIEVEVNKPKIAYLSAKPFGQTLGNFSEIEKELKKRPPYDVDSYVLTQETLQSLTNYNYLVLVCHLKNDKLIIENEWCGSERITLEELQENLDLDDLKGIIVICDELPTEAALSGFNLPIIFMPELKLTKNIKKLWFQVFKKQSFSVFEESCVLYNISLFDFGDKLKVLNGKFQLHTTKLPFEISKDEVAKFIGRQQDIEEVSRKLFEANDQNEFITILGAGGLGKTSLVKKLAVEYNNRNIFDAGVTFIDCEHLSSYQQFHRHIASAFDLEDAVDLIEHIIENTEFQNGERLIIVDNAESLLFLGDKVKILNLIGEVNQYSTLVITSRESLDIHSEKIYQLRDFVSEEALLLFESKTPIEFSMSDKIFLKKHILKEYLDHNPLAISLVASTLIQGKDLKDLKIDLDTNFFELTQTGQENFSRPEDRNIDRKSSIYNSIDYSYKMLEATSKEALVKLSYFPDGIDLSNFKKLTEKDTESKGKAPIKDATIKALQDKSLVQSSSHYIRLHPLVARFAQSKINVEEQTTYLKVIFDFQLSFLKALNTLNLSNDLSKQTVAKTITNKQIKNFCFIAEKLNPDFDEKEIYLYLDYLSAVSSLIEEFQEPYNSIKQSVNLFNDQSSLYKLFRMHILGYEYYLGNFDKAYKKILSELPLEEWLSLDFTNLIERRIFLTASQIYCNEGIAFKEIVFLKNNNFMHSYYSSGLIHIGIFSKKLAEICNQNSESLYVKWACGLLTLDELAIYIDHLHPKEHIHIASMLILKAKLTTLNKEEITKIVVVNPYTKGIKHLLNAMHTSDKDEAKALFNKALPELKHIKFAYTAALLEFATWLYRQGEEKFEDIYIEGLESAKKFHFHFLQHSFLQITADDKVDYNEADYPFPDNESFLVFTQQLIKYNKG
jgi:predicted ATPase